MLIDKGLVAGEIVTLKTIGGEEIVGKLVEEKDAQYELGTPLLVSATPQGIGLVPYMFSGNPEKNVPIYKHAICSILNTDPNFADQYIQATTGLSTGVGFDLGSR